MSAACPAWLIAGPASGQGKTTITAALARYHTRQGRRVRVFKVGPDYLDPMWLEAASSQPVYQLDLWLVGEAECRRLLYEAATAADLILIEGVMGLYDGAPSAADLARTFGVPALIVIAATGLAETFGAIAQGLATYQPGLPLAGIAANRVASVEHATRLRESLPPGLPWRGAFFRLAETPLPDRHLGLVQAGELADLEARLDRLADGVKGELADLPAPVTFSALAVWMDEQVKVHLKFPHPGPLPEGEGVDVSLPARLSIFAPPRALAGVRIGIARDAAFAFLYRANLDLLAAMGAELRFFSPLRDAALPEVDSVYLPGGYPELHLPALAGNHGLREALRRHVAAGKPLLAECGGMLYLLDELTDAAGQGVRLCGLLPGRAVMGSRLAGLGLQTAEFPSGSLRAHTFHYSRMETGLTPALFGDKRRGGPGEPIYREGRLTASYLHWYLPSCPEAAAELLAP